ncbi:MAG: hypothetical protein ACYCPS_03240 [Candidatus Saccharimonadales bacterium]
MKDKKVSPFRKYFLFSSIGLATIVIAGLIIWYVTSPNTPSNPFNSSIMSSTSFSLYYPTKLPPNYQINKQSVTTPQSGVVVFTVVSPSNKNIYISEEARPITFNLGGYYTKFSNLKETVTNRGTIAVGYINNHTTEIGSLAINKAWILINTNAHIPLNQITAMLKGLTKAN